MNSVIINGLPILQQYINNKQQTNTDEDEARREWLRTTPKEQIYITLKFIYG